MDRGKAKFETMDTIKTEVDNPNASNITRNFHKEDVQMQGGPGKKVVEHDPMKNIMTKGLVHHMQMPSHVEKAVKHVGFEGAVKNAEKSGYSKESAERAIGYAKAHASAKAKAENPHLLNTRGHKVKGFTLDGTEVPTNHIGDKIMSRGNAEFTVGKGIDLEVKEGFGFIGKGGETSDTMPPDPGHDVAEDEKLSDKASKDGKRGKRVTNADDLTFAPDVDLVGSKAKEDIASGYVQDSKESSKKGFDRFNEMVEKGLAADVEINPHNINEALGQLDVHTDAVIKGLGSKKKLNPSESCKPKMMMKEGGVEDETGLEEKCSGKPVKMKGAAREAWQQANQQVGGHLGRKIATNLGIQTAAGAGVGAGVGHLSSDEQGKASYEGLRRGAKRGAVGGFLAGPLGGAIGGYTGRSTPKKRAIREAKKLED